MSRGKRLTKPVIDLVARESAASPETDRRALAARLQHRIGLMQEVPPSRETLVKMISGFRNCATDDADRPWTLAESVAEGFPPDATPTLLTMWRYCHALGKPFSVRQAKWAVYLRTVISSTTELVDWADLYATHEKAHALRNVPFDSSDADAALTMSAYEHATAVLLGKARPVRFKLD